MIRKTTVQGGRKSQTFSITAPTAQSVQLVGDFTHWNEQPINLQKEDGAWRVTVELDPGEHHYRFLVDGRRRDDPECTVRVPNPYASPQPSVRYLAVGAHRQHASPPPFPLPSRTKPSQDTTVSPMLSEIDLSNFDQEVLRSPQPVLVEFWAGWCTSSRRMTPVLSSLAEEHQGALKVARVNVERSEALAERYLVRAVPTLLIFQAGAVQDQLVGPATERDLRERLEHYL